MSQLADNSTSGALIRLAELDRLVVCGTPEGAIARLAAIDDAYMRLVESAQAGRLTRHQLSEFFLLFDQESEVSAVIVCPHGEPMHMHHDGCPVCDQIEP